MCWTGGLFVRQGEHAQSLKDTGCAYFAYKKAWKNPKAVELNTGFFLFIKLYFKILKHEVFHLSPAAAFGCNNGPSGWPGAVSSSPLLRIQLAAKWRT